MHVAWKFIDSLYKLIGSLSMLFIADKFTIRSCAPFWALHLLEPVGITLTKLL